MMYRLGRLENFEKMTLEHLSSASRQPVISLTSPSRRHLKPEMDIFQKSTFSIIYDGQCSWRCFDSVYALEWGL